MPSDPADRKGPSPAVALSPDAFPQAALFVPQPMPSLQVPGMNPELIKPDTDQATIYPPYVVWGGGFQGASPATPVAPNSGAGNAPTGPNGVSIPEPGSMALLLAGISVAMARKLRSDLL